MKTAMQELIEYFNERPEYDKTSEGYEIIEKAKQFLEKEKEQIVNAAANHCYPTEGDALMYAEQYYNQTYNN
jgi:hypothetical protein